MRIVAIVNMRGDRLEPLCADNEMQMRGPVQRITCVSEQPAHRAVVRHAVSLRHDRPIAEAAIKICAKQATQIILRLQVGLLVLVEPLSIRLPGDDFGAGDRLAVKILHTRRHGKRLAHTIERDRRTRRALRCIIAEERPPNRIRSCALRPLRVDFLDQRRGAQEIGQQHPFLSALVACVANLGQEGDHLAPLVLCRPEFLDEVVDMLHDSRHQLRQLIAPLLRKAPGKDLR